MKNLILIAAATVSFSAFASTNKCGPCNEVDILAKDWAAAKTPEKSEAASEKSTKILKDLEELNRKGVDQTIIHAMVSVLGTIYQHDDDPLDDELMHLKPELQNKAFREVFDKEVAKLPSDEKEKIMTGIDYVEHPTIDDLDRE